ncbi:hypothetical protein LCGC14_2931850, partial [marine sediment metagenome]
MNDPIIQALAIALILIVAWWASRPEVELNCQECPDDKRCEGCPNNEEV